MKHNKNDRRSRNQMKKRLSTNIDWLQYLYRLSYLPNCLRQILAKSLKSLGQFGYNMTK